jgi:hypothetical protein
MAAAWIGFAGGLIAALISAFVALRQTRMAERLTKLDRALDAEVHRADALFDRDLQAEEVLTRYRQPLAAAAFDLQSRLYNILQQGLLVVYGEDPVRGDEVLRTTVFRLAQYFGWTEILRRDIQFLSFPEDEQTRRVSQLQLEIAKCFLTDGYGRALMIWSDEQRAIGERMVVDENGRVLCMGYARFSEQFDNAFGSLGDRLQDELPLESAQERLRDVQHLLCELVETLDTRGVYYHHGLERA